MSGAADAPSAARQVSAPASPPSNARRVLKVVGALLLALLAIGLVLALVPTSLSPLGSLPDPAPDYDTAIARYEAATDGEDAVVFGPCRSRLYAHGARTETAVVLVHGLTNCPRQFVELAEEIHSGGSNVLVLRIPYHGLGTDDLTAIGDVDQVGPITASDYRAYGDTAIDIAEGLGEEVDVLGLSLGGVITAWVAQNRDAVDQAVVIAPAIGLPDNMPSAVDYAFRNFFGRVPNLSITRGGTTLDHAYVGEASHAIAQMYILAEATREQARATPPAARSIAVVTNGADTQLDNEDIAALAELWRAAGTDLTTYEFPAEMGLPHDLIDVGQPDEQTDAVYPVLLELLWGL